MLLLSIESSFKSARFFQLKLLLHLQFLFMHFFCASSYDQLSLQAVQVLLTFSAFIDAQLQEYNQEFHQI